MSPGCDSHCGEIDEPRNSPGALSVRPGLIYPNTEEQRDRERSPRRAAAEAPRGAGVGLDEFEEAGEAEEFNRMCRETPIGGRDEAGEEEENAAEEEEAAAEDEEAAAEDEEDAAEEGEENDVRIRRPPGNPTKEEVRKHRATHVPYRSWCPVCVAARAHRSGHVAAPEPLDDTPQIAMDYCFLRRGRMMRRTCQ